MDDRRPLWSSVLPVSFTALAAFVGIEAQTGQTPPTFNERIAPILIQKCAPCHHEGGVAPFPLVSYEDVRKRYDLVLTVTMRRAMPPTRGESDFGTIITEPKLTDEELVALQRWVRVSLPEGRPESRIAPPDFPSSWRLGEPQTEIRAGSGFTTSAEGGGYWNAYPIEMDNDRELLVRGFEALPAAKRAVRQVIVFCDMNGALWEEAVSTGKPISTFGSLYGDGIEMLAAWAPGYNPLLLDDAAIRIPPRAKLVVQVLYYPTGKPEDASVRLGFHLATSPGTRRATWLRFGREYFEIPPAVSLELSDPWTTDNAIDVFAAQPEARYQATMAKCILVPPDGEPKNIVLIPSWDMYSGGAYNLASPVRVPAGSRIIASTTYDNFRHHRQDLATPTKPLYSGRGMEHEVFRWWVLVAPARQ